MEEIKKLSEEIEQEINELINQFEKLKETTQKKFTQRVQEKIERILRENYCKRCLFGPKCAKINVYWQIQ